MTKAHWDKQTIPGEPERVIGTDVIGLPDGRHRIILDLMDMAGNVRRLQFDGDKAACKREIKAIIASSHKYNN